MLTVKLINTAANSMVIIEAPAVKVVPNEGGGRKIECDHVGDMGSDGYVIDGKEYDVAYIENARGSTLEVVRP